jgi:2-dehydro-3-deoxy-D-arabinonate dehydratase
VLLAELSRATTIQLYITRNAKIAFSGSTTLAELKRELEELVAFLFRENGFPAGVFLITGTGIVPGDDFTLVSGDVIRIQIDGIGSLENYVA